MVKPFDRRILPENRRAFWHCDRPLKVADAQSVGFEKRGLLIHDFEDFNLMAKVKAKRAHTLRENETACGCLSKFGETEKSRDSALFVCSYPYPYPYP